MGVRRVGERVDERVDEWVGERVGERVDEWVGERVDLAPQFQFRIWLNAVYTPIRTFVWRFAS